MKRYLVIFWCVFVPLEVLSSQLIINRDVLIKETYDEETLKIFRCIEHILSNQERRNELNEICKKFSNEISEYFAISKESIKFNFGTNTPFDERGNQFFTKFCRLNSVELSVMLAKEREIIINKKDDNIKFTVLGIYTIIKKIITGNINVSAAKLNFE